MSTALYSKYIINGVQQDCSPAELLGDVVPPHDYGVIVDETEDPALETHEWDARKVDEYSARVARARRTLPLPYADVYTRCRVAEALIEALWHKGHFRLEDLSLKADWKWTGAPVGALAAFYNSVQAAAEYSDSLGIEISSYLCTETVKSCDVNFKAVLSKAAVGDEFGADDSRKRSLKPQRCCPATLQPDPRSWLVYIPFDTSEFRLGGSLLAQAMDLGGGVSPQIMDADYFMDCFEVVRELVEDGIVVSAVTVGEGGLLSAAKKYCAGGPGTTLDLSDMMKAFEESNIVRVLFAEIPGVLLQIRDTDFDYLDAELLLQDVAFYPLGHPSVKSTAVRVKASAKSSIQMILESLMQNAEGED